MAENYNSVPRGVAGSGRAVIFDQNIATRPTSIWQQQNKFNAAQKAAEAKLRQDQQKANDAKWKDMLFDPDKVGAVAQAEYNTNYTGFIDKHSKLMKQYNGGAVPPEVYAEMQQEKAKLKSFSNYWSQAPVELSKIATGYKAEKYLNQDIAESKLIASVRDENGKLKDPAQIDFQRADAELRQDSASYNRKELVNGFLDETDKFYTEKFSNNGRFEVKTTTEANLPIVLNADGTAKKDAKGRLGIIVNDASVERAKNYPPLNNYLMGVMKQKEEQFENGEIDEMPDIKVELKNILQDYAYAKTSATQNRNPQPKSDSGSEDKKKPVIETTPAWSNYSATNANGVVSAIATPGQQMAYAKVGGKLEPIETTVNPRTVYDLNENGKSIGVSRANANQLNIAHGPTILVIKTKTGKTITMPADYTPEQQEKAFAQIVAKYKGEGISVVPFATGTVIDKEATLKDMAELVSAGQTPTGQPARASRKDKTKQTQRSVAFELLDNDIRVPAAIRPNDELKAIMRRMNSQIEAARTGAKVPAPVSKQSKVVANLPKPTTTAGSKPKSKFVQNLGKNN